MQLGTCLSAFLLDFFYERIGVRMKILSGCCELNQYKRLVPVGLDASHKDGLGILYRYGYCVVSIDVTFVYSLFMGHFYSI